MIAMTQLDHLVLTVKDIPTSVAFYTHCLGMEKQEFAGGRIALNFGQQKINLHQWQHEFEPKAGHVQLGSADLCFITNTPIQEVVTWFIQCGIEIEEGPVQRTGATGPIISVYIRDPDMNLIEVANRF
ncbi:VOC family protein [Vibrio vulnificus]|uniref:VOC family protein n=1 Tax=Vibrio vulnificus TaxID=672 RepID=UPI001E3A4CE9